jgi:hypothetical protein
MVELQFHIANCVRFRRLGPSLSSIIRVQSLLENLPSGMKSAKGWSVSACHDGQMHGHYRSDHELQPVNTRPAAMIKAARDHR